MDRNQDAGGIKDDSRFKTYVRGYRTVSRLAKVDSLFTKGIKTKSAWMQRFACALFLTFLYEFLMESLHFFSLTRYGSLRSTAHVFSTNSSTFSTLPIRKISSITIVPVIDVCRYFSFLWNIKVRFPLFFSETQLLKIGVFFLSKITKTFKKHWATSRAELALSSPR